MLSVDQIANPYMHLLQTFIKTRGVHENVRLNSEFEVLWSWEGLLLMDETQEVISAVYGGSLYEALVLARKIYQELAKALPVSSEVQFTKKGPLFRLTLSTSGFAESHTISALGDNLLELQREVAKKMFRSIYDSEDFDKMPFFVHKARHNLNFDSEPDLSEPDDDPDDRDVSNPDNESQIKSIEEKSEFE